MKTKEKKVGIGITLADFDQQSRAAIVCEVIGTMLDVDRFVGDCLDEDTLHALAERFAVPFMVLHLLADGRVTAEDMRAWCAFERGKAVA